MSPIREHGKGADKDKDEHQPNLPKIFRGFYLQHCDPWPKPRRVQNARGNEMMGANTPYEEATMQVSQREQAGAKEI